MSNMRNNCLVSLGLVVGFAVGCSPDEEGPVDFGSEGVDIVRERACTQNWDDSARKGAGAEIENASLLWPVSPYQVLVPSTATGFVTLEIDVPHYDWLIYLPSSVRIESLDGPELEYGGPVQRCAEQDLVEYGAHHDEIGSWSLRLEGEARSRVRFYAGLVATSHSDPEQAGHAGHDPSAEAPDHAH